MCLYITYIWGGVSQIILLVIIITIIGMWGQYGMFSGKKQREGKRWIGEDQACENTGLRAWCV